MTEIVPAGQLTLFELAGVANREHALALGAGLSMIEHALAAGEALLAAKAKVQHGEWLLWLEENFAGSEPTAQRYMRIASNPSRVTDLKEPSLRKALEAVANNQSGVWKSEQTSVEWYTPARYIEAVRNVLGGIDLDPASSAVANETVGAARFYTADENGLEQPWQGRMFMNPPYGHPICGQFVGRALDEYQAGRVQAAILLLNGYSFDSRWFRPLFDYLLCFTDHRVDFYSEGRVLHGGTTGSVFAYLGPKPDLFVDEFDQFGAVVERWRAA